MIYNYNKLLKAKGLFSLVLIEIGTTPLILLTIHILVFVISSLGLIPIEPKMNAKPAVKRESRQYNVALKRFFPFTIRFIIIFYISAFFYPVIFFQSFSDYNIIYSEVNIITLICFLIISGIVLFFLIRKTRKEYNNSDMSFRKKHSSLKIQMFLCIYAASIVLGAMITHYTNFALDFSKKEEYIVSVTNSIHRTSHQAKGSGIIDYYEIYFTPSIKNLNRIKVNEYQQAITKKNDKLKLYLKKGLFGLPYITDEIISAN